MEHTDRIKINEIEEQSFKNYLDIKSNNFNTKCIVIGLFLILCVQGYINYKQSKRLDAHKEVITLLNEKNDNLSTRLELLTENQIMIYKKVKKYERKTKIK